MAAISLEILLLINDNGVFFIVFDLIKLHFIFFYVQLQTISMIFRVFIDNVYFLTF